MMVSKRTFVLACTLLSLAAGACSSNSGSDSPNPDGKGDPQASAAIHCDSRCAAAAEKCGVDSSRCAEVCARATESQLQCLENVACDDRAARACLASGGGKPDASAPDSGPPPNNPPSNPTELLIGGAFGTATPRHVLSDDRKVVTSLVSLDAQPRFRPSTPREMPDLFSAATTDVSSPNLGTCAGRFSWTLNSDQIALIFEGTDTLPATACYDFAEALASGGIDAEIPNVRYPSGGSVAVKVTLR